jgi:hypothetical protein
MEVWDYDGAMTPLFHVLFATFGKIVSPALPFLRAVDVIISYACGFLLFCLFRFRLAIDFWTSLLIALTLTLSPYVFGVSFLLMTDNLANLLAVAAIFCTLIYIRDGRWNLLAFAALFASSAVLTRQLYVWLFVLVLAASFLRDRSDPIFTDRYDLARSTSGAFALIALACSPLIVLFVSWGGVNPPNYHSYSGLDLSAVSFFTACLGLYAAPFLAVAWWTERWSWGGMPGQVSVIFLAAGAMLWAGPLQYHSVGTDYGVVGSDFPTDGYLWQLSRLFPPIGGSSLLFWILVPCGVAAIVREWRQKSLGGFTLLAYVSFALVSMANTVLYQKYFEFPALLICCLMMFHNGDRILGAKRSILLAYCLGFAIYAVGAPTIHARMAMWGSGDHPPSLVGSVDNLNNEISRRNEK